MTVCEMHAGRALTTYSFLETPVPPIYQNVNSVYGYVRMRVNATTLITEVHPLYCERLPNI